VHHLPASSMVRFSVYDIPDREVGEPVSEMQNAGPHEKIFESRGLTSGTHMYRMQARDFSAARDWPILR